MLASAVRSIDVLGCRVDDITMDEAVAECDRLIAVRQPAMVVTPNAEIVMAAQRDPELRRLINGAALSIPDGAGLLLAGRLLGTPLRAHVQGTDLCYRLVERGHRIFLLGAAEGVAEAARGVLERQYPQARIVGTFAGRSGSEGDAETRTAIAAAGEVDVIFVAYGAPRQERWIARNQRDLGVPLALGIGGVLDFMSGRVRRAPLWIRRLGFDWAFRLAMEPWRWRRQLALPRFVLLVLRLARRRRPLGPQPQR